MEKLSVDGNLGIIFSFLQFENIQLFNLLILVRYLLIFVKKFLHTDFPQIERQPIFKPRYKWIDNQQPSIGVPSAKTVPLIFSARCRDIERWWNASRRVKYWAGHEAHAAC